MKFFRNLSIAVKILVSPAVLVLALLAVSLSALYGLNFQRQVLGEINDIALTKITRVDEFIALSEQVQSDVFRISVLRFMNLPEGDIQPLHARMERGLNDLNVIYGQILREWSLDEAEQAIVGQMKEPLDAFRQQAQQAVTVAADDPSFGVILVRAATIPFAEFRNALTEFLDYQKIQIVRAEEEAAQRVKTVSTVILTLALGITLVGIVATVLISSRLIAQPIHSMTDLMRRLAGGDLLIEVADLDRRDEIGGMARAVEVFRHNAIDKAHAEQALRQSEERYHSLFDNSLNGVAIHEIVIDESGTPADYVFIQVNRAFEELTDLKSQDILGKHATDVLPGIEQDPSIEIYGRVALTGRPVRFEQFSTSLNRHYDIVAFSMQRGRFATTFSDITEQKRAEDQLRENERLLRTIAENYPHSYISIIEQDLTVGFTSGQEFHKQNLDPEQYVGLSLEQVFGDQTPVVREHYLRTFHGLEQTFELSINNQHQLYRTVPLYAQDGTIPRILAVVENITERKQAQEALQAYSDRLEEMVAERTRALEQTQEQLIHQEKLAVLGQLSGSIAHELRTPLGAIKNTAYLLHMILGDLDSTVQETLAVLDQEIRTSEQIINNLLDFARTRQPQKQPVDVNQTANQALARIDLPDGVCVQRDLADLPPIAADPGQLGQILGNLLLNAIQAMPDGGQLTLKTCQPQPSWTAISVADTGVGIPPQNLERLFEPLFTTKSKGIGLGLALAKMLVDAHGGTIEVESQVGKGTTFTVSLPHCQAG